jgi:hypothetical protein
VLVGLAFGRAQTPSEQALPPAALLMAQRGSDIQLRKPSQFFQPVGLQPCWLAILLCRLLQISAGRKLRLIVQAPLKPFRKWRQWTIFSYSDSYVLCWLYWPASNPNGRAANIQQLRDLRSVASSFTFNSRTRSIEPGRVHPNWSPFVAPREAGPRWGLAPVGHSAIGREAATSILHPTSS